MQGYYVQRRGGWDTHGLPVEIEVEKRLGLSGKQQIEDYGIAELQQALPRVGHGVHPRLGEADRAHGLLGRPGHGLRHLPQRVRGVALVDREATLGERICSSKGHKIVPLSARCGTPLSSHELSLGYKEGTIDPSVFVKFQVTGGNGVAPVEPGDFLLAWTTTPWTLPGNVALAVGAKVDYVKVRDVSGDMLVMAKGSGRDRAGRGLSRWWPSSRAKDLLGVHYAPLYAFFPVESDYCYVVSGDFVSTDDGTGIVHVAPGVRRGRHGGRAGSTTCPWS